MGIGLGIAAGGLFSLYGASKAAKAQERAAGKAGDVSLASTQAQIDAQLEMFYKSIELGAPFRDAALKSITSLSQQPEILRRRAESLEAGDGDAIYGLQKRRLDRSLASRGIRQSGQAVVEESGLAASEAMRIESLRTRASGIEASIAGLGGQITQQGMGLAGTTGRGIASSIQTGAAGQMQSIYAQGQSQAMFNQGLARLPWQMASTYANINRGTAVVPQ